jgi:hypothetical protein
MHLDVVLPVFGGIAATLLGVFAGSGQSRRQQTQAWLRDHQVEASAAVVREAMRAQIALARKARDSSTSIDWAPWSEALSVMLIVGDQRAVAALQAIDQTLWDVADMLKAHPTLTDAQWDVMRGSMEAAQLSFVNTVRGHLIAHQDSVAVLHASRVELPSALPAD